MSKVIPILVMSIKANKKKEKMKDFVKNNINQIINVRTDTGLDSAFLNKIICAYNNSHKNDWVSFSNFLSRYQK